MESATDNATYRLRPKVLAFLFVLLFILLLVGITRAKTAWFDEVVYASGGVNWACNHQLGPAYPGVPGIQWPLYMLYSLGLGWFYRVFGIGLLQTRLFGVVCYAGLLFSFHRFLRTIRLGAFAAVLGTLFLGLDRSVVWLVRSGRPDTLAVMFICFACWALSTAVSRKHLLPAGAGGALCVLAVLSHPYSAPAIGVVVAVFLVFLPWRSSARSSVKLTLASAVGVAVVLVPYGFYLLRHADEVAAAWHLNAGYVQELGTKELSLTQLFLLEMKRRWVRGTFIQVFRWAMVLAFIPAVLKTSSHRKTAGVAAAWMGVYFLVLWLFIHKHTWYQVVYASVPFAMLVAVCIDATQRGAQGAGAGRGANPWMSVLLPIALVEGFLLLALYPAVSVLQWDARSYGRVEEGVAEVIPRGSRVATDYGSYFAVLANDCDASFILLWQRGYAGEREESVHYQEQLLERGIDYVVIRHGAKRSALAPELAARLVFVRTIGAPKKDLPFAGDPAYWFDIYRVSEA